MDEVSTTIAAAPEEVWALVTDITRMGEWSPGNTGGRWVKGAIGPAMGARFIGSNKHGWIRWVTHCEVIECEQPRRFAFRVAENKTQWGWKLEPTKDGGTLLTQWRNRVGTPALPVRAFGALVFGSRFDEVMLDGMRSTLAAVKATAENAQSAG